MNQIVLSANFAIWLSTLFFSLPVLAQPSFDCYKARSSNEKLICADAELATLDTELAQLHRRVKALRLDPARFQREGKEAMIWREQHCTDKACLQQWYGERTKALGALASTYPKLQKATPDVSVQVTGVVQRRVAPPTMTHDEKPHAYPALVLKQPLSVYCDGRPQCEEAYALAELQLVIPEPLQTAINQQRDRPVRLSGQLMTAHTGFHYTRYLLIVDAVNR